MADQFSQEYKAFILSDEAKGLLQFARWNVGDWWTSETAGRKPYLLDEPLMEGIPVDDDVRWFPTLWQLLQIIEGAGYVVKLTTLVRRDGTLRYHLQAANHDAEDYIDEIESDLMLAAAKLAVRVLTNHKYTNHK